MNAFGWLGGQLSRGVVTVSAPFHPFGGAVDIVVVEQEDGSFKSSPWYVQFGKFQGVLKAREKVVSINVNGVDAGFRMYLDSRGGAYFLREVDGEEDMSESVSSSGDDADGISNITRPQKIMSANYDLQRSKLVSEFEASNGKVVTRTSSNGPRILGFVFGRRSKKENASEHQENVIGSDRGGSLERAEIAADLLEVRWSTSLATRKHRKDRASGKSDPQSSVDGDIQKLSSFRNDSRSKTDSSMLSQSNGFLDSSCINDEGDAENPLSTVNYMDCFNLEETYLDVNVASEGSVGSNEVYTGIIQNDEGADKSDASGISSSNSFSERLAELKSDAGAVSSGDEQCRTFQVLQAGDEIRMERVQSSIYCEASESFMEELDSPSGESSENVCSTCSVSRKTDAPTQARCDSKELISDSEFPSSILACQMGKNIENIEDKDPCRSSDGSKSDAVSTNGVETVVETKVEVILECKTNHGPVKYVEEMVVDQVPELDSIEHLSSEKPCSDTSTTLFHLGSHENNGSPVTSRNECSRNAFQVQMKNDAISESSEREKLLSTNLDNSEPHTIASMGFRSPDSIRKESNYGDFGEGRENKVGGLPEKLSEEQFFFSDLDGSEPLKMMSIESTSLDFLETENNPQYYTDSSEEKLGESTEMLNDSHSFIGELIQEGLPNDQPTSPGMSRMKSSPISIARVPDQVEQVVQTVESLPSFWSPEADEMNAQGVKNPISHSLDSSFDKMRLVQGDVPIISGTGVQKQQSRQSLEHSQISAELRKILSEPAVEISLCRHLLYEGMGHEAAACAFDAEKLDMEKLVSLGPDIIKNDRVVVRIGGLYFPWDAALPIISAIGSPRGEQILEPKGMITVDQVEKAAEKDPRKSMGSRNGTWRLWPFRKTGSMNSRHSIITNVTDSQRGTAETADTPKSNEIKKKVVRANTPTSEQLASLNLKEGRNEVTFTFSTPMLGEQKVDARIYLWKWNARVVISDVDGTITRSDVLGQFMPMVGVDWSQTGVTRLFSAIKENGYELLFLSARAISQAALTRHFLFNLKQDGKALPEGPVVISPDGLFPSLFREVIRRAPHEFKIACLEDIKALFPPDHNPFYAGFGNRDTDEISYLKVGIPKGKIFTINPRGEVSVQRRVDTKSYTSLHTLVHDMFPPLSSVSTSEQEDFNSWNFWRLPPPHIGV